MKKDRDMMYYGVSGYAQGPTPMMMPMQQQVPFGGQQVQNSNYTTQNELENRLARIERQIRRLDNRISKLENPYPDSPNYQSTEINIVEQPFKSDNSMYMM